MLFPKPSCAILTTFFSFICLGQCERFLFFFGFSTYSHRIAVWPYVERLVAEGHQVTFLSPFHPLKPNPNVEEIVPPNLNRFMTGAEAWTTETLDRRLNNNHEGFWYDFRQLSFKTCELIFQDAETKTYLNSNRFDVVVVDAFYNECGFGLSHKYGAITILYSTSSVMVWHPDTYGFFPENNWIPDITRDYSSSLGFLDRVQSTMHTIYWHFVRKWFDFPDLDEVLIRGLDIPKMPGVEVLEKNVSLILYNNHFSTEFPRTLPPMYVGVGGLHCQKDLEALEPLPKEIAEYVGDLNDEGFEEAGFFYISFGTFVPIHQLPPKKLKMFFDVLSGFNIRFLWKWDGPAPPKVPANVKLIPWAPQQTLLAHPKIRGFLSHAGLLSVQEAITHSVPLIVIPIVADQDYNAEKVAKRGYGIRLDLARLRPEGLRDAISNIMNEARYREKMAETTALFHDRPMKPLDTALWWTKYVLRNNGAEFLKSPARLQNWLQLRFLDIWLFMGFLAFLVFLVSVVLIRQVFIVVCSDEEDEEDPEERKERLSGPPPSPKFDPRARYIKSKFN